MQQGRHKGKSRSADYILIAAKGGDTTTLSPKGCQTSEPSGRQAGQTLESFALKERSPLNPHSEGVKKFFFLPKPY